MNMTVTGKEVVNAFNKSMIRPNHYKTGNIECIDYIKDIMDKEAYEGFLHGNIIKYISRYKHKNGLEDLKKANVYLNWLIESVEK